MCIYICVCVCVCVCALPNLGQHFPCDSVALGSWSAVSIGFCVYILYMSLCVCVCVCAHASESRSAFSL